jgi:hypothetical protein
LIRPELAPRRRGLLSAHHGFKISFCTRQFNSSAT